MAEDRDSSGRIKVVDKRWFTEDGELRQDRPKTRPEPEVQETAPSSPAEGSPPAEAPAPPAPAQGAPAKASESSASGATSQMFVELVATLAQQAELLLSGGGGLPKQPEQAQRVIDYMGVLEDKTRGNLSSEESQLLSSLLFELRTLYVQSRK